MYLFHRHIDLASELKKAVGLAVGAAIYSAGLNLFLIPNHIIDGGITGISLLVQALTGIPFSVLIVLLNLPFFYIGYRRLGARLALSSTFAIVILSLCSSYFETMKPATSDPFLSTIFGGIIIGMGVGIVIKSGGSTDGTEIMAIWMDNKFPFSVGEIIMFFNFFILGAAGFVFSWNSTMYSLIAYFICSRMIDAVSTGLDSSKGVFIVTTSYDAVSDAIVHDMHRAVTRLHGQGGFLKDDKDVLYCVVSRLEITKLKQVVHAIDDVPAKISIAEVCWKLKIPVISSMGTGNRLRPEMLQIADINKTSVCHLARKMRKELKERRVRKLTVVYSKELPHKPVGEGHAPGSISFVPPVSGMMMAGYVVRALLKENGIG